VTKKTEKANLTWTITWKGMIKTMRVLIKWGLSKTKTRRKAVKWEVAILIQIEK